MERSPTRDFAVGVFVLAGLCALAWLSINVGGFTLHGQTGLKLSASFDETGSLAARAPVVIAGVRVGEVSDISLQGDSRARVVMNLDDGLKVPADTAAAIVTAGVLGDRYIELQPGHAKELLKSGDTISYTEPAVVLEKLIGSVFSAGSGPSWHGQSGLKLSASFDETAGLASHAPVVMAGVRVGEVSRIVLQPDDNRAKVEMDLDPKLNLPEDSSASILSSGLMGGRYIELQAGSEDRTLKSGESIHFTESAVILERVIGQLVYGITKGGKAPATEPANAAKTQADLPTTEPVQLPLRTPTDYRK